MHMLLNLTTNVIEHQISNTSSSVLPTTTNVIDPQPYNVDPQLNIDSQINMHVQNLSKNPEITHENLAIKTVAD